MFLEDPDCKLTQPSPRLTWDVSDDLIVVNSTTPMAINISCSGDVPPNETPIMLFVTDALKCTLNTYNMAGVMLFWHLHTLLQYKHT